MNSRSWSVLKWKSSIFKCYCTTAIDPYIHPHEAVIYRGTKVTFTCKSDVKPVWKWIYQESIRDPVDVIHEKRSITIKNAEPHHRGYYQCVGRNKGGNFTNEAVLKIKGIFNEKLGTL